MSIPTVNSFSSPNLNQYGNTTIRYTKSIYLDSLEEKFQTLIKDLFTTIGSSYCWTLLLEKPRLEKIGQEIQSVHPLNLLEVIFTDSKVKDQMKNILNNPFKWNNFIKGFSEKMDNEASKENLLEYTNNFSKKVNVSFASISTYFKTNQWDLLVEYLINSSGK
jgi:hypothetical protein